MPSEVPDVAEEAEEAEVVATTEVGEDNPEELLRPSNAIEAPNILTCQVESGQGVLCTSNGGKEVIFAVSPPPVPGRMSSRQSLQNSENLTSSTKRKKREMIRLTRC